MTAQRGAFPLWSWIPLGLALALYSWLWLDYENLWLDDAFISFRYARNLAAGLGPVFNPGEYVEGYTTFLWMLTNALAFAVTDDTQALAWIKYSGWLLGWCGPGPNRCLCSSCSQHSSSTPIDMSPKAARSSTAGRWPS
jgi:hypothetical protein